MPAQMDSNWRVSFYENPMAREIDEAALKAALLASQAEKERIDKKIAAVQAAFSGLTFGPVPGETNGPDRRRSHPETKRKSGRNPSMR